uniref:NfeD family protein n=5 Tax=unclassified Prevotella TaxID=2638335 RepID=A0AB33JTE7_9BACT
MIEYFVQHLWLFWTIIVFVCLILELTSGDFFITCFAIGASVACGVSLLDLPFWVQVLVWAVASVMSIWLIRPHLVARIHAGADERLSNADALIGRVGRVSETIVASASGRVKIDGDDWKAVAPGISEDIAVGSRVKVVSLDSIILTVEPVD